MTKFTDQHLSAYIDGELSEALTHALHEALQHDADLAQRLRALEQANETFLTAHSDIVDEPIPQFLLDTLESAPATSEDHSNVVSLPSPPRRTPAWLMPLAACLVLAIGIGIGSRLSLSPAPGPTETVFAGPISPGSDLHRILETVPSGESQAGVSTILTFASVDGGFCREVETPASRSIACRDPDQARWTVLASISQDGSSTLDTYIPASADPSRAIEQVVDQLMTGIPLTSETESALLTSGWSEAAASAD